MTLDLIINKINDLVPLPQVVAKVLEMSEDPDVSAAGIAGIITKEEVISMKLLKLANSPFFGTRQRTNNIRQAIVILGMSNLKTFILSMGLVSSTHELKSNILNRIDFWKHNIATAVIAKEILLLYDFNLNIDDIFLSGLLHDIGKLAMINFYKEKYDKVIHYSLEKNESLYESERNFFKFDHQTVGFEIAKKWNFPKIITDVISNHHRSLKFYENPTSKQEQLEFGINAANIIATLTGYGTSGDLNSKISRIPEGLLTRIHDLNVKNFNKSFNDIIKLFELCKTFPSPFEKYQTIISVSDVKLEKFLRILLGSHGFSITERFEIETLLRQNARILIVHDNKGINQGIEQAGQRIKNIDISSWLGKANPEYFNASSCFEAIREQMRGEQSI